MKKICGFILMAVTFMGLFCCITVDAATKNPFNVTSKEKFLGSLYKNLLIVNEEFYNSEDPYESLQLHRYGLVINDVLEGKNQYEEILKNRNMMYVINNSTAEIATIYSAKFEYQKNSLYPDGYSDDFDRLKLSLSLNYNGNYINWKSNMYYRYYNKSQNIYGYFISYEAKKTIQYSVDKIAYYNIVLIDTKKLIIWKDGSNDRFSITRDMHYNRNQNNPTDLPNPRKNDFVMRVSYGMNWDNNAYFHKIGEYDGDTSNINNSKHSANMGNGFKFEVVYSKPASGARIITSPTVMGTYNFADWTDSVGHRIKDIIPYLMWGNTLLDSTTLKERYYFDYDNFVGGKNYTKRGNSLFNSIGLTSSLSISLDDLSGRYHNSIVDLSQFV